MSLFKVIIDAIRQRKLPMIGYSPDGRTAAAKCPRCGAPIAISISAVDEGKPAFQCPKCGETASWKGSS